LEIDISLTSHGNQRINISVTPESNQFSKEIFYKLNNWAESTQLRKWIQLWKIINQGQWFLVMIYFVFFGIFIQLDSDLYKKDLKNEANLLLKDGIDSTEITESIEIMLSLDTKFVPKDYKKENLSTKYYLIGLIILIVICIPLSFSPKSNIEIGLGKNKIKKWKIWIRIISITIPIGIILPIFINKIGSLI
jgi:hypothetical protein